jgi:hypothetical protein
MGQAVGETDLGLEGRPGVKLALDTNEYAIGQVLSNGYTITWTTPDSAAEAIARCVVVDHHDTTATALYDGDHRVMLHGSEILPFLKDHECWWVKVRRPDSADYVVYVEGADDAPNELAALGEPLDAADGRTATRVQHVRSMMEVTATDTLREHLPYVFERLVATVRR